MTPAALAAILADRDPAALPMAARDTGPDEPAANALQGEMLRRAGDAAAARPKLEAALKTFPEVLPLHHLAALACAASGDSAAACQHWQALLAKAPATAGAWFNLGQARHALGDVDGALDAWARAAHYAPNDPRPLLRAGSVLGARADLPEAIDKLSRAIALAPAQPRAWYERAAHRSSLALHGDAVADLTEALRLAPDDAAGHSALLVELHYDPGTLAPEALRERHEAWAARHATATRLALPIPAVRPRLRVAYLSPRFGDAPLEALFLPVVEAHDRSRFEIACYAAHPVSGLTAERICNAVDLWRHLPSDDDEAAALIAGDDCDVLVDLAGHAPGNRMTLLARKPARVQACWLDWFDTTGVAAIDYLIGDPVSTPPGHAARFSERLALLPHARFAYRPPVPIARTPTPAERDGFVTFGSFNRHAKLTDDVAETWREVLRAVPDSRLVLRAAAYRSRSTVRWIRERWAARGVPVERVDFQPFVPIEALHAGYATIDVALDPFPFNGGVTTCDALAHGVPVIALEGDALVSRQGAALLAAAGRPYWVATTRDDYVRKARELADASTLARERAALFDAFPSTPLADVAGFTHDLERLLAAIVAAGPAPGPPIALRRA